MVVFSAIIVAFFLNAAFLFNEVIIKTIVIMGDSGAGKSESLEALSEMT